MELQKQRQVKVDLYEYVALFWKSHCATCVHACDFVPCDRIVQRAYSEKDSCGVVFIDEEFLKSKLQNLQHYKLWIVSGIRSSPGVIALFRPQEQPGLALENRRTVSYSPRQRTLSERLEYFDPQTGTEMLPCAPTWKKTVWSSARAANKHIHYQIC